MDFPVRQLEEHCELTPGGHLFALPLDDGHNLSAACPYRLSDPDQGTMQTAEVSDELDLTTSLDFPR